MRKGWKRTFQVWRSTVSSRNSAEQVAGLEDEEYSLSDRSPTQSATPCPIREKTNPNQNPSPLTAVGPRTHHLHPPYPPASAPSQDCWPWSWATDLGSREVNETESLCPVPCAPLAESR